MKLSTLSVRKGLIAKLKNAVTYNAAIVPVYGNVPNNASYPYIKVSTPVLGEIDYNDGSFNTNVTCAIDVVTRAKSDASGFTDCDSISNLVSQLVRTRSLGYIDLSSDGFSVYKQVITFVNQLDEQGKDNYYYRTIITLDVRVQQLD